jgi:hypothetical protein
MTKINILFIVVMIKLTNDLLAFLHCNFANNNN